MVKVGRRDDMNNRQKRTLAEVFENPTRQDIRWLDIQSLLKALHARVSERSGSRVAAELNGVVAIFHRPHPGNEADRGTVRSVRRFLEEAGVTP